MRRRLAVRILVCADSGNPIVNPSQSEFNPNARTLEVYAPGVREVDTGWHRDCVRDAVLTFDDGRPRGWRSWRR